MHRQFIRTRLFVHANGPCRRESRLVSVEGWPAHASDWWNPPFSQTNADPSGVDSGRWTISPIRALTRYTLAKIGLHGEARGQNPSRKTRCAASFENTYSSGCKLHTMFVNYANSASREEPYKCAIFLPLTRNGLSLISHRVQNWSLTTLECVHLCHKVARDSLVSKFNKIKIFNWVSKLLRSR